MFNNFKKFEVSARQTLNLAFIITDYPEKQIELLHNLVAFFDGLRMANICCTNLPFSLCGET